MKTRLFSKEEREAIDIVLSMGLVIQNPSNAMDLVQGGAKNYEITDRLHTTRDYENLSSALVPFMKLDFFNLKKRNMALLLPLIQTSIQTK